MEFHEALRFITDGVLSSSRSFELKEHDKCYIFFDCDKKFTHSLLVNACMCWSSSDVRPTLGSLLPKILGIVLSPSFWTGTFFFLFFFFGSFLVLFFFSPCIDLVYSHFICERVCLVRPLTLACIYIKTKIKKKKKKKYWLLYI